MHSSQIFLLAAVLSTISAAPITQKPKDLLTVHHTKESDWFDLSIPLGSLFGIESVDCTLTVFPLKVPTCDIITADDAASPDKGPLEKPTVSSNPPTGAPSRTTSDSSVPTTSRSSSTRPVSTGSTRSKFITTVSHKTLRLTNTSTASSPTKTPATNVTSPSLPSSQLPSLSRSSHLHSTTTTLSSNLTSSTGSSSQLKPSSASSFSSHSSTSSQSKSSSTTTSDPPPSTVVPVLDKKKIDELLKDIVHDEKRRKDLQVGLGVGLGVGLPSTTFLTWLVTHLANPAWLEAFSNAVRAAIPKALPIPGAAPVPAPAPIPAPGANPVIPPLGDLGGELLHTVPTLPESVALQWEEAYQAVSAAVGEPLADKTLVAAFKAAVESQEVLAELGGGGELAENLVKAAEAARDVIASQAEAGAAELEVIEIAAERIVRYMQTSWDMWDWLRDAGKLVSQSLGAGASAGGAGASAGGAGGAAAAEVPPVLGSSPGAGSPGAGSPGAGSPGAGAPGAGSPGAGSPGAGSPGAGSPGAGSPGAGSPGAGSPGAGAPVAGSPGAGAPVAGSPGAGSPGAGAPVAGSPGAGSPGAGSPGAGSPGGQQNPSPQPGGSGQPSSPSQPGEPAQNPQDGEGGQNGEPSSSDPGESSSGQRAKVTKSHTKQDDHQINLQEGETLTHVREANEGWMYGTNSKGESGYFPSSKVDWKPPKKLSKPVDPHDKEMQKISTEVIKAARGRKNDKAFRKEIIEKLKKDPVYATKARQILTEDVRALEKSRDAPRQGKGDKLEVVGTQGANTVIDAVLINVNNAIKFVDKYAKYT